MSVLYSAVRSFYLCGMEWRARIFLICLVGGFAVGHGSAQALDYERDIMPIFKKKCFDCHSAEADKVKGGLRLDDPQHFKGRFAKNDIVVPGNWDASYLFVTVTRPHDAKEAMPPEGKGKPLTPDEVMKVANWIHEGASVDREKGEQGPDDYKPEDFIKFKDGVMVTDSFGADPDADAHAKAKDKAMAMEKLEPQPWTNREGVVITATFLGLEGEKVLLELNDGRKVPYPLANLSDASQAEARRLGADVK